MFIALGTKRSDYSIDDRTVVIGLFETFPEAVQHLGNRFGAWIEEWKGTRKIQTIERRSKPAEYEWIATDWIGK